MNSTTLAKIMLVDDEPHALNYIEEIVQAVGFEVVAKAYDGKQALEILEWVSPDLILLDVTMPGMQGDELLEKIKATYKDIKVVMVTTRNSMEVVKSCADKGAEGYILKNEGPEYICQKVQEIASTLG